MIQRGGAGSWQMKRAYPGAPISSQPSSPLDNQTSHHHYVPPICLIPRENRSPSKVPLAKPRRIVDPNIAGSRGNRQRPATWIVQRRTRPRPRQTTHSRVPSTTNSPYTLQSPRNMSSAWRMVRGHHPATQHPRRGGRHPSMHKQTRNTHQHNHHDYRL